MGKTIKYFLITAFVLFSCVSHHRPDTIINTQLTPDISQWIGWRASYHMGYYILRQVDQNDSLVNHINFIQNKDGDFCRFCKGDITGFEAKIVPIDEVEDDLKEKLILISDIKPNRIYVTGDILCVGMEEYKVNYAYTKSVLDSTYWVAMDNNWYRWRDEKLLFRDFMEVYERNYNEKTDF